MKRGRASGGGNTQVEELSRPASRVPSNTAAAGYSPVLRQDHEWQLLQQQAAIEDLQRESRRLRKATENSFDQYAALVQCLEESGLLRRTQIQTCLHRFRFQRVLRKTSHTPWNLLFTDIVHTPGVLHPILQFTGMASIRHVAACARVLQSSVEISQQYAVRPLRVYLLGGSAGNHHPLSSALSLDISDGSWQELTPMPTARDVLAAAAIDGHLYAVGGTDGERPFATVERYNAEEGIWRPMQPMPTARGGLAAAAVSGRLYVVGGSDGIRALGTVERYDVGTDTWQQGPSLLTPRRGVALAATHRYLYVLGGSDGSETLNTVERFDTEAGARWERMPSMPTPRRAAAATILNGRLYVTGGAGGVGLQDPSLAVHECFDLQDETWRVLPPMPSARRGLAVLALEGVIYALGGSDGSQASSAFEIYDPASEQWEVRSPLPVGRGYFGAAAMQTLEVLGLTMGPASVHQLSDAISRLRGGGRRSVLP